MYRSYMHVERLDSQEVEGILCGECYVFPKLDGTNAVISYNENTCEMEYGSRKRALNVTNDNAGFANYFAAYPAQAQKFRDFMLIRDDDTLVFYGEWNIGGNQIKSYEADRKGQHFYLFDVWSGNENRYLHYAEYAELAMSLDINVLPPLKILVNPIYEDILEVAKNNTYFMEPGAIGEGIVLKNYQYRNPWGHVIWGKLVLDEFKAIAHKNKKQKFVDPGAVELAVAEKYVTRTEVYKEIIKMGGDPDHFNRSDYPRLLQTMFHIIVAENMWDIVKKFKNPTIDFKVLRAAVTDAVKTTLGD